MAFNPTNLVLWSQPNAPGPAEFGYETTDNVATVTSSTYFSVFGNSNNPAILSVSISAQDLIVATCSDGVAFLRVVSINPIVTEVDVDEGAANRALSNLTGVAINASLISDTDITDDLGSAAIRWNNIYSATLRTGDTATDTLVIGARDVDGAVWTPFITLTSANTPTCVLADGVTATTQAPSDNSTKVATTAYADAAISGAANKELSNLNPTTINTSLISDTDITDDLGTEAIRWNNIYSATLRTGDTAADTLVIGARDVDGAAWTPFITLTADNTPTCVLADGVSATTQAPNDNTTKVATTAYADAAIAGAANKELSNLNATTINTSLISDTDITDDLGSQAIRWNNIYAATLQTGDTAADTLQIGAWDVDGAAFTSFITFTANNTPTCALSGGITSVTQAPSDNSTKVATTAYVDTAVSGATLAGITAATPIYSFASNSTASAELRLYEDTDFGTNYVGIKAPTSMSADYTITMPTRVTTSANIVTNVANTLSALALESAVYSIAPTTNSGSGITFAAGYQTGTVNLCPTSVINSPIVINTSGGDLLSNRWYFNLGTAGTDSVTGFAVSNDVLYAFPIFLPAGAYDNFRIAINTADASATADIDVGIYSMSISNTSERRVGFRAVNCGTISNINSTGEKTLAFAATGLQGWWWIGLRPDNIGTALSLGNSTNLSDVTEIAFHLGSANSDATNVLIDTRIYGFYYNTQTSLPSTLASTAPSGVINDPVGLALQTS